MPNVAGQGSEGVGRHSRRDFLKVGSLGTLGLSWVSPRTDLTSNRKAVDDRSVILLLMVGGPSQLETWDPKPDAPSGVRGPFGSIATSVPGVRVSEYLPGLGQRMNRLALVRSMHHDAAPIHETGHQLVQTGGLCRLGQEHPHFGSVVARALGPRGGLPPSVIYPGPIGHTGVAVSHGDTPGDLGPEFAPAIVVGRYLRGAGRTGPDGRPGSSSTSGVVDRLLEAYDLSAEPDAVCDAYGRNAFGRGLLRARRLVEGGTRVVTVNMFTTVFDQVTWDCHGSRPFSTLDDYRRWLLPAFDTAFSALLDDLSRRGRLESTLVVATGEFGRTPRLNASGGRDHWPGVWSAVLAGGGVRGGQVIGASDAHASEPTDRPVTPPMLLATIYRSLGLDPIAARLPASGPDHPSAPLAVAEPIAEAFG